VAKRLFVAIPLPANVKAELNALIHVCRREAGFVRWVRPEHLHVTLKFLGDVEAEQESRSVRALEALESLAPFQFNLAHVGAFPDRRRPRVIWTGIEKGQDQVVNLAGEVERLLAEAGFEREARPFSPHVTIGRLKDKGDLNSLWNAMTANTFVGTPCAAADVRLVHSTLTPRGPIYTDVASFALRGVKH